MPSGLYDRTIGLLTHVDRSGRVIDERLIEPNDGQHHGLTQLTACVAAGDEVLAFGSTYIRESKSVSGWVLVLDAAGNVKQERLLSVTARESNHVRVFPNGDAVFTTEVVPIGPGVLRSTRVIRVDSSGSVMAQSAVIPNAVIQAVPTFPDPAVRLIPSSPKTRTIITLSDQLDAIGQVTGQAELIISKRAYYLPDHSIVLFGGKEYRGNSFSASIAWISPDLTRRSATLIEPPLASDAIVDAVPTGVNGEFATIRVVSPMTEIGRSDSRLGVVLAFVQIK
jgi:hypothetical protein